MMESGSGSQPRPDSQAESPRPLPDPFLCSHLLRILFPQVAEDAFMLEQLRTSIEAALAEKCRNRHYTFADFANAAVQLRHQSTDQDPAFALILIDFTGRKWDPLFVHAEIVRQMKAAVGRQEVLLVIENLALALFPDATYRTRQREATITAARDALTDLVHNWTTRSTRLHLLFV